MAAAGALVATSALVAFLAFTPGTARTASRPASGGPEAPVGVTFLTNDSVTIGGTWFSGGKGASAVVLAPRSRGDDAALAGVAKEFQRRGFSALTFVLRDPPAADPQKDSLRWVVLASRWAHDAAAAMRYARAQTDSTSYVFAWGQGLGANLALIGASHAPEACDGIAVEQLLRTTEEVMRENGTQVIADAQEMQMRLLRPGDEPLSAATRLTLPAYAILTAAPAGAGGDPTFEVLRRHRGRTDRWRRPWITAANVTPTPGDVDTLAAWYRTWTATPRIPPR